MAHSNSAPKTMENLSEAFKREKNKETSLLLLYSSEKNDARTYVIYIYIYIYIYIACILHIYLHVFICVNIYIYILYILLIYIVYIHTYSSARCSRRNCYFFFCTECYSISLKCVLELFFLFLVLICFKVHLSFWF